MDEIRDNNVLIKERLFGIEIDESETMEDEQETIKDNKKQKKKNQKSKKAKGEPVIQRKGLEIGKGNMRQNIC